MSDNLYSQKLKWAKIAEQVFTATQGYIVCKDGNSWSCFLATCFIGTCASANAAKSLCQVAHEERIKGDLEAVE